jgi:hypothetical protein
MDEPVFEHRDTVDGPPPFLGTWTRVYIGVLLYLVVLIVLLYLFSRLWAA